MVFSKALEVAEPAERARYVAQACGENVRLRAEVESLLGALDKAGSFLEAPAAPLAPRMDEPIVCEAPGTQVAAYKLLELIGEGGFGVVFMAEQQQPVRRKVAVKILKPGMDTRQVIARFEAERQALALMDHPNIAHILDGGETASGRPYFVMELVKGVPITDYCDQEQLTPRERLPLFLAVCQAVQHAHQKGIIHRDLKPSNVLVTLHDGTPVVKVIDFGIAKATGEPLTDKTLFTNFAQFMGTPLYMSPEQAAMSGLDVDTRSDIYSLGVLLYELLTGTTPFEKERFKEAGYDEMRRIIREEEPPKPSTRMSTLGQAATTFATHRKSAPKRLSQLFRGELDWIVMKCLEKDRNRRYESASALADDVQHYLRDEPVQACPPSAAYRFHKFARRNKRVLLPLTLLGMMLLTALVGLSFGLVTLKRERDRTHTALDAEQRARAAESKRRGQAREALDAMTSLMLEDLLARQQNLTEEHKKFLRQALQSYEEFATDTADDEASRHGAARALANVGRIRYRLAPAPETADIYRQALRRFEQLTADFPREARYRRDLAGAQRDLGRALVRINKQDEGRAAFMSALVTGQGLIADHPAAAEYQRNQALTYLILGQLALDQKRSEEAETSFKKAIALLEPLVAQFPDIQDYRLFLARSEGALNQVLAGMGEPRSREALGAMHKCIEILKGLVAESSTNAEYRLVLAQGYNNLANRLKSKGKPAEIEQAYRDALALFRRLAAEFPAVPQYRNELSICLGNLGILLLETGRSQDAEPFDRDALHEARRLAEDYPDMPEYWATLNRRESNLGLLLMNTNRASEGEPHLLEALAIARKQVARLPHDPGLQHTLATRLSQLGILRRQQKQLQASCELLHQAAPLHLVALKSNPRHSSFRSGYRENRWFVAINGVDLGDHASVAAAIEEFKQFSLDPVKDFFLAACALARASELAAKDSRLTDERRKQLAMDYARRAVESVREAVGKGYKDLKKLRTENDLAALRSREDFHKVLADLEAKITTRQ
jgi:serine/threonine protein kinase/tetratricopeptide (TPR) repeat protein